ncbi:hypothetical protein, partial [Bilophila sp.]|uniref:hypothetical protein n=1 Tax=Bilophila sp. TaxID=1929485 RepID=UPI0030780796
YLLIFIEKIINRKIEHSLHIKNYHEMQYLSQDDPSPKGSCKGLWRNGRHGKPSPGARLPARLQNVFYSHNELS